MNRPIIIYFRSLRTLTILLSFDLFPLLLLIGRQDNYSLGLFFASALQNVVRACWNFSIVLPYISSRKYKKSKLVGYTVSMFFYLDFRINPKISSPNFYTQSMLIEITLLNFTLQNYVYWDIRSSRNIQFKYEHWLSTISDNRIIHWLQNCARIW